MAPTLKPASMPSSSQPAKGTNPAPDFSTTMNRIQLLLDARLRLVSESLLKRDSNANSSSTINNKTSGGAFSSLTASTNTNTDTTAQNGNNANPEDSARARQKRLEEEEASFAEERALDPNAGIGTNKLGNSSSGSGLLPGSAASAARERERENKMLRGKLQLGKRKGFETAGRGNGKSAADKYRLDDDDDDEPGRGGLGRSKKNNSKKRKVVEVQGDDEEKEGKRLDEEKGGLEVTGDKDVDMPDVVTGDNNNNNNSKSEDEVVIRKGEEKADEADNAGAHAAGDKPPGDGGEVISAPHGQGTEGAETSASKKNKKKRKNKKKNKSSQSTSAD